MIPIKIKKNNLTKLVRVLGLVVFIIILIKIDIKQIPVVLANSKASLLPAIILSYYLLYFLKASRWIMLIRKQGLKLPWLNSLQTFFSSALFGILTIGQAGDFVKAYSLKKLTRQNTGNQEQNISFGKAGVSVVIERLMDSGLYLIFGGLGILLLEGEKVRSGLFYSITIAIFIYLSVLYLLFKRGRTIIKLLDALDVRNINIYHRLLVNLKDFLYGFCTYPAKDLIPPLLLTFCSVFALALCDFFLARSLGINVPYLHLLVLSPLFSIAYMLPVSVAGFGTRELTIIYCFSHYAVSPEKSVTFSLCYVSFNILTILLVVLILLIPRRSELNSERMSPP
jgi:uncharacterized protein (TIRG00374 family)